MPRRLGSAPLTSAEKQRRFLDRIRAEAYDAGLAHGMAGHAARAAAKVKRKPFYMLSLESANETLLRRVARADERNAALKAEVGELRAALRTSRSRKRAKAAAIP
jgi:hypothetical protein